MSTWLECPCKRANFLDLFQAIAQGDGAKAGRLMLSRSREHRCTDPAAFEEGMRQLVAKARPVTRFGVPLPGAFALNKLRIGEVWLSGVGPDTRRYTEIHGDAWRYTEMHGDTLRCMGSALSSYPRGHFLRCCSR